MDKVTVGPYAHTLIKIYAAYNRERTHHFISQLAVEHIRKWAAEHDPPITLPEEPSEGAGR